MTTFVLVHGAWAGAHGFRKIRRPLHLAGHDVFTPSLTGIGERAHLTNPHIDLSIHVHDVVNTVLFEDLDDIVLLGFSYGGMVVTGALDHIGDRVKHLIYLDAFVPSDGESLNALRGALRAPITLTETWLVPPFPRDYIDPADKAFMEPRRVHHPARCFSEPVRVGRPLEDFGFPLTYVKATSDPSEAADSAFWKAAAHAKGSARWNYHEIAGDHMIPTNKSAELISRLLSIA